MENIKKENQQLNNCNIPIQLDCVCSTQGNITPRWFRYEDENHKRYTVEIDRILAQKELNFVGIKMLQFICAASINEMDRIFEIRYNVFMHKWTFFQMFS